MRKTFICMTIVVGFVLLCIGGCSRRKSDARTNGNSSTSPAKLAPPPQDRQWEKSVSLDLLFTRYLDENSDVVLSDYSSSTKKLRSVGVIQGKSWFTEEESSAVPYDFALEVTDHPNRLILFRKRSNPSLTPSGFTDKATEEEVKRLEILGKEPYVSREERTEAFLNAWSDIVLVRCGQISGKIQDFYAYKGNHFKSDADIGRHKDLIIQAAYKSSYNGHKECILYGNFDRKTPEAHVVWIAQDYLLFPGRQAIFEMYFKNAASKLRKE